MAVARSAGIAKLVSRTSPLGILRVQGWSYNSFTSVQTQFPNQCNENAMGSLKNQCDNEAVTLETNVMAKRVKGITRYPEVRVQTQSYSVMVHVHTPKQKDLSSVASLENQNKAMGQLTGKDSGGVRKRQIGENVSRKDKISILVGTLIDLKDSKEVIYGALDSWVAWEQNFPIGALKNVLLALEKEQQWHRVVQVIKWMLSKGQGNTMGTYGQLIKALDMDHRAEEAHQFWVKKIGCDLHSVPWQLCKTMISIYYRNNMLESLVKLFKGLEAFDRKPPEKSIVQKVANAYEMLGLIEERDRVLVKYESLFSATGCDKKRRNLPNKKKKVRLILCASYHWFACCNRAGFFCCLATRFLQRQLLPAAKLTVSV